MKGSNKGITLIALIITIIVLLILAGITIGALTSNNSVLKQAGSARNETREAEEAEKVNIAIMDAATNASKTVSGELTTEFVKNAIKGQFGEEAVEKVKGEGPWTYEGEYKTYEIAKTGEVLEPNATIAKDSNDVEFYLPRGATHIEDTTVDSGLVISYKGSEFVWIPVNNNLEVLGKNGVSTGKKMAKLYSLDTNTIDSNGRTKYEGVLYDYTGSGTDVSSSENTNYTQSSLTNYREPAYLTDSNYADASTYNTVGITEESLQEEYDAMIESVKKYGGFYIGRYESSLNGTVAASKAGVLPMSAVENEGNTWYGLYQKQKDFATSSDSVVSEMIWGSQWDAMLNWVIGTETDKAKVMQNSNGNHHESPVVKCGSYHSGSDKINNIYDLEGNLYEWTKEANNTGAHAKRGGGFAANSSPSNRLANLSSFKRSDTGSRLSLYIK